MHRLLRLRAGRKTAADAAQLLLAHPAADMATLSAPLPAHALLDTSKVKVLCGPPLALADEEQGAALAASPAPCACETSVLVAPDRPTRTE